MHRTFRNAALVAALAALAALAATGPVAAQGMRAQDGLVGSWVLVAADSNAAGEEPERARGARGLLIIDAAGHVFEFFSTSSGDTAESPAERLENYGGFWGRYELAAGASRLDFEAWGGVSPSVHGLEFSRSFTLDGDRLELVSTAEEPQAQADMRWIYQRFPVVENLSPAYREVVGFWQHVVERQVNLDTGEVLRSSERAPSVIVYTPSGFVGVHFPPVGREPFASATPSADAAQAGLRGYIGYFGTLTVFPGEVTHNLLSGVSPATGSILRRYAEIEGDELVVQLQSMGLGGGDGPQTATEVVLRRLSGADDMLPR